MSHTVVAPAQSSRWSTVHCTHAGTSPRQIGVAPMHMSAGHGPASMPASRGGIPASVFDPVQTPLVQVSRAGQGCVVSQLA
jgi:hypothetical protein